MYERSSNKLLKPKEIASTAGVLPSKIAFYTSIGLLVPAHISDSGQKLYDAQEVLAQMGRIKKLTEKGFSLDDIKNRIGYNKNLRRLLVIDDDEEVSDLIRDILKDEFNFDMLFARDGFEAGRILGSNFPDLIVLDLNLPGINGFELCRMIRQDEFQKGVKILAVTGYYSQENADKIIEYSADAVMAKPFDVNEFVSTVLGMLQIKKKKSKNFILPAEKTDGKE